MMHYPGGVRHTFITRTRGCSRTPAIKLLQAPATIDAPCNDMPSRRTRHGDRLLGPIPVRASGGWCGPAISSAGLALGLRHRGCGLLRAAIAPFIRLFR